MKKIIFLMTVTVLVSSAFLYSQSFDLISSTITINEISLILKSTSAKNRLSVINLVYSVEGEVFASKICAHYFEENDKYIQKTIVEYAAYKTNIKECSEVIKDAFENQNDNIRNTAFLSLNETMGNDIIKTAKNSGKKEKNRSVKINFLQKISSVDKSSETVKLLSDEVLNSKDDDFIKVSLKGLGRIKTKEAKNELEKYSKSKDKRISDEAKKYLKK